MKRAHSATKTILHKPGQSAFEIHQIGRWKIKHPGTFLGHGPLSLEHWPLWLAGVRWPCPIPPSARHSSQCKQKTAALIRCPAMTVHFLALMPDETIVPRHTGWEHTLQDSVNIDRVRQTKMSFVLYCFCVTYFSISCATGDGFLIFDCLYLQIGWWPFVCRWPHLRWHLILGQKKWVVLLDGAASKPEQITNTANLTRSHSWPIAKASRPTERDRERKKQKGPAVYIRPTMHLTPLWCLTERLRKTKKEIRHKPSAAHHDTGVAQKANKSSFTESVKFLVID